jgi:polyhydroxyalkanoate synthesis regulator phasin
MAERDKTSTRGTAEKLFLAGVGAASLTKERVEELADELSKRGSISPADARQTIEEVIGRWRSEAARATERAGTTLATIFRELGLVTRKEYEEIELRLAQVEHRLRLLERDRGQPPTAPPGA